MPSKVKDFSRTPSKFKDFSSLCEPYHIIMYFTHPNFMQLTYRIPIIGIYLHARIQRGGGGGGGGGGGRGGRGSRPHPWKIASYMGFYRE